MFKWIAKRVVPIIAANLDVDIDTVSRDEGIFLHVHVTAFGLVLVNRYIKVADPAATIVDRPVDIHIKGN